MTETEIAKTALEIDDPAERMAFVERACGQDPKRLESVYQLIQGDDTLDEPSGDFFDATSMSDPVKNPFSTRGSAFAFQPGEVIGPYKLRQRIGEGGMGSVWMAEQQHPVKRLVALKIIKAGMDTAQVIARFEAERQALALMNHPNIARVLDAGATSTGRPYFVMELVRGIPITEYCDQHQLSTVERINLFKNVCQAVQHAHQKGVIHRDIKPSNVLVAEQENQPSVKVIDFGLAKATSQKLTEKTLFTAVGQMVGTPAYMSPEQAEMSGLDVDTRTDVYSLGVLLYELLSGATPLETTKLRSAGYAEIQRMICEVEPEPMSEKISSLGLESAEMAENRSTDWRRLTLQLRGDLDVIVMKALDKERGRRYATPSDFADDLNRFLKREPIEARPASAIYRMKKMAQRNQGKFVAATLILLALIGGFIGTAYGMLEAQKQAAAAKANLATAEENYQLARQSVEQYFTLVSENRLLNEPYMEGLRRELLEAASEFYQSFVDRRKDDPTALADLGRALIKLGRISWETGEPEKAIASLEAGRNALEDASHAQISDDEVETIKRQVEYRLSEYYFDTGREDDAVALLDSLIKASVDKENSETPSPENSNLIARALRTRGKFSYRRNEVEAAKRDYLDAIERFEQLTQTSPNELNNRSSLAGLYQNFAMFHYRQRNDDEATEWVGKSLKLRREILQEQKDSIDELTGLSDSLSLLSHCQRRLGRLEEARQASEESVETSRSLTQSHPQLVSFKSNFAVSLTNLGVVHQVLRDFPKCNELNEEAIRNLEEVVEEQPTVKSFLFQLANTQSNHGNSLLGQNKLQEALTWYEASNVSVAKYLTTLPDDPRARKVIRNNHWGRADAYVALGQFDNAVEAFDETIEYTLEKFRPEIRMARAMAVATGGDHQRAIEAVLEETSQEETESMIWFDAARVLAVAVKQIEADGELVAIQRQEKLETAKQLTVAALRNSFEGGYLVKADEDSPLLSDEFKSLADLEQFKTLLLEAEVNLAD